MQGGPGGILTTPVTFGAVPIWTSGLSWPAFVVRLAVAQLRGDDRAQDLARSVWLSVIPLLARDETIAHPHSFLATVVRRRAIDYSRSAVVR